MSLQKAAVNAEHAAASAPEPDGICPTLSDELLIARGKFATLGSQRRTLLKLLRDDMERLCQYARVILNAAQEPNERATFAPEELQLAEERLRAAKIRVAALVALEPQLLELKPKAWGKEKSDE